MISAKRILTILGTLFCALGTGFFMQHYMQEPQSVPQGAQVQVASIDVVQGVIPMTERAVSEDAPVDEIQLDASALTSAVPVPPRPAPHPEALPDVPIALAALDDQPIIEFPSEEPAPSFECGIDVIAKTAAAAMVELEVRTPCMLNARFTVHHNGMMFTDTTDTEGYRKLVVPAMTESAIFIVTFAGGTSAVAHADVTSLEYYDRAVIQWTGPKGLEIHALEYAATYGETGHVWSGASGEMARAARGEGGFVVRLGDDTMDEAHVAEIYTFPAGTALREGEITLNLEAEVTTDNCGRDIEAQSLQKSGLQQMTVRELVLSMPACTAVGEYLVLKNMFDDLKIARN